MPLGASPKPALGLVLGINSVIVGAVHTGCFPGNFLFWAALLELTFRFIAWICHVIRWTIVALTIKVQLLSSLARLRLAPPQVVGIRYLSWWALFAFTVSENVGAMLDAIRRLAFDSPGVSDRVRWAFFAGPFHEYDISLWTGRACALALIHRIRSHVVGTRHALFGSINSIIFRAFQYALSTHQLVVGTISVCTLEAFLPRSVAGLTVRQFI